MATVLPVQRLQVRLAKTGTSQFSELLERPGSVQRFDFAPTLQAKGAVYIRAPQGATPDWLAFLQTAVGGTLNQLTNQSNSAVMMLEAASRIFVFTYGHGRHLLSDAKFEPDFGFRTAINGIVPRSLRSIDSFTLEERPVSKRIQTPDLAEFREFGLEVDKDVMRAATGSPRTDLKLEALSGTDMSLAIAVRTDIEGLVDVCARLLSCYKSKRYQKHYPWVDHVQRVSDPSQEATLWGLACDSIRAGTDGTLSPPTLVSWEDHAGFSVTRGRRGRLSDNLSLAVYRSTFSNPADIKPEKLQADRLREHGGADITVPRESWPIFRCLQLEVNHSNSRYVVRGGVWYKVDDVFAKKIERRARGITRSKLKLPAVSIAAGKVEAEGDYNARAATACGFANMDKKTVRCEAAGSSVEVCDLLTANRELIHVKKRQGGSSTLSHLFAQARVSAEALIGDEEFRKGARTQLAAIGAKWTSKIPAQKYDARDFTVVLAFMNCTTRQLDRLPFFSQLNMVRTADAITRLGYHLEVLAIPAV